MTNNTKLEDKLEGAENFWAWKYRVLLILEEHDLENYVKKEVVEPKGYKDNTRYKNMVKVKRIIVDSIKDHSIPRVSSLNFPRRHFIL